MYEPRTFLFDDFDAFVADSKEEGNFYTRYKKPFKEAGLDADEEAEGLEIVRKATNATQYIYKHLTLLKAARKAREDEWERQVALDGLKDSGNIKILAELDKEVRKQEHAIVTNSFDISRLREPLEEFLILSGVPERNKYNKKAIEDEDDYYNG